MSTYAWVDLGAVLFPFLFSFHPRLRFYRNWPALFIGVVGMMALFVPWDALFTHAGIWGFNAEHVWNVRACGLPIEEWAFFVCVPYACLFTYHCFKVLGVKDYLGKYTRSISIVLIVLLVAVALCNWQRTYTSTAWAVCAIWIAFTAFIQRAPWLGRFYLTYLVLLLPFLAVNGILTGTGLERPVVWYDNTENLGVRILTIPVEDIFYGMFMVGLVTTIYEVVLARRGEHPSVGRALAT